MHDVQQLAHVGYTGSANGGGGGAREFVDEAILFCPQYGGEPSPPHAVRSRGSLPTVSGTTLNNGYAFTGLSPSIASSGVPTDRPRP